MLLAAGKSHDLVAVLELHEADWAVSLPVKQELAKALSLLVDELLSLGFLLDVRLVLGSS